VRVPRRRARRGEQARDLGLEAVALRELARVGRVEERVVGRRVPKEVRQARRELVIVEGQRRGVAGRGRAELLAVEEVRRLQQPAIPYSRPPKKLFSTSGCRSRA
jgi:hypothetical protein